MTTTKISEQNLIEELRVNFPEIEGKYQAELLSWRGEEPGNYNIVAFVFKPYLKEELAKGEITDFLQRFGAFLERVCASGDREAINVMWLKVFKLLLAQPKQLKLLWPVLGPVTRANIEEAAGQWNMVSNLPSSGWIGAIASTLRPH